MNLLTTIFGGMILTAVLYGLGRLGRLSNFWAAVMSALVPSLAYLAYASLTWPGLDTITMHIVAYPTVSVLLSQLYSAKADHSRTLHWAPKLMVGFFVFLSLVYGALAYIAGNGLPPAIAQWWLPNIEGKVVHTGFAGVVEHHQEAAKVIGHQQKIGLKLARLGWSVEVDGLENPRAGVAFPLTLVVTDTDGRGVEGVDAVLNLARIGQVDGQDVLLSRTAAGSFAGQGPALEPGNWMARVRLRQAGESLELEHEITVQSP